MADYTAFNNGSNSNLNTQFGQIGVTSGTGANATNTTGADGIIAAATGKINTSADQINQLLAKFDPSNPASLLQAQQALANYNLALTVTSSFIKSVEDTAKAVAQHVS